MIGQTLKPTAMDAEPSNLLSSSNTSTSRTNMLCDRVQCKTATVTISGMPYLRGIETKYEER